MRSDSKAIIVGGGHNGLVCAFYLARAGFNVSIYEKNNKVGGAAITEEFFPGFRNSVASYTVGLLNSEVIKDMKLYEKGLKIIKRPISNFLPLNDKEYLKVGGDIDKTINEFKKFSSIDAKKVTEYYSRIESVAEVVRNLAGKTPINPRQGIKSILKGAIQFWPILTKGNKLHKDLYDLFTKSAQSFLDGWFENEHIKAAFGFDSIVGNYASPQTPGSAYVLLHHVFGEIDGETGVWGHAIGGMGSITQAMKKSCIENGVIFHTDSEVKEVLINKKEVNGIRLKDGKTIYSNIIVSNLNPKLLYKKLIQKEYLEPSFLNSINNYQCGSGTFRMNVALSELPDFKCLPGKESQDHHKSGIVIAPTLKYMDEAFIDSKKYGWSKKPIVEMLIPSTVDETLAPKGKHVASLFCQQFTPKFSDGRDWDDCKDEAAETIINTVNTYAPNFKDSIIGKMILSPKDLEKKFGLVDGDIMHGKMTLDQMWAARPILNYGDYRGPIKNLYMCGSGTHPGGGVTGMPGKNAAKEILNDFK